VTRRIDMERSVAECSATFVVSNAYELVSKRLKPTLINIALCMLHARTYALYSTVCSSLLFDGLPRPNNRPLSLHVVI
jgi:hypothetical protein